MLPNNELLRTDKQSASSGPAGLDANSTKLGKRPSRLIELNKKKCATLQSPKKKIYVYSQDFLSAEK